MIAPVPVKQPWRIWVNLIDTKLQQKHIHAKLNMCIIHGMYSGMVLTQCLQRDVEVILKEVILQIDIVSPSFGIHFSWVPQNPIDKAALVLVMTWCRPATSHCVNQCWLQWANHTSKQKGLKPIFGMHCCILIQISLKFVFVVPVNNQLRLAWFWWAGNNP